MAAHIIGNQGWRRLIFPIFCVFLSSDISRSCGTAHCAVAHATGGDCAIGHRGWVEVWGNCVRAGKKGWRGGGPSGKVWGEVARGKAATCARARLGKVAKWAGRVFDGLRGMRAREGRSCPGGWEWIGGQRRAHGLLPLRVGVVSNVSVLIGIVNRKKSGFLGLLPVAVRQGEGRAC